MPAPSSLLQDLPRSRRLQRPGEFAEAREHGRRVVSKCFILNWMESKHAALSRLGVVTSRKVGPAVVRNRARRLLREVFRRHQHAIRGPLDVVLVARAPIAGRRFAEVEREYLTVLRRNALTVSGP